ncbi:MAG: hypothetical protein Q4B26_20670, partial [Eubacteriales bacterium]|nr:hypothetical protein [Eubacteriales bacterium]
CRYSYWILPCPKPEHTSVATVVTIHNVNSTPGGYSPFASPHANNRIADSVICSALSQLHFLYYKQKLSRL